MSITVAAGETYYLTTRVGGITLAGGTLVAAPFPQPGPIAVDGQDNVLVGAGDISVGPIVDGTMPGGIIFFGEFAPQDIMLQGPGNFSLGITIAAGIVALEAPGAAGSGPISFAPGGTANLQLVAGAIPSNSIENCAPGDTIDFAAIPYNQDEIATVSGGTLTLSGQGTIEAELTLAGTPAGTIMIGIDAVGGTALTFASEQAIGANANWDAGDSVNITAPGDYTIAVSGSQTVGALALDATGATLAVAQGSTLAVGLGLELDAGLVDVAGDLVATGLDIQGATLVVSGGFDPGLPTFGANDIPVFPISVSANGGAIDLVGSTNPIALALSMTGDAPLALGSGATAISADLLQPGSLVTSGAVTLSGTTATVLIDGGTLTDQTSSADITFAGSAGGELTILGASSFAPGPNDPVVVQAGAGADTVAAQGGADTIFGGAGQLTFLGSPATEGNLPGVNIYTTQPYAAEIIGGAGAVSAYGAVFGSTYESLFPNSVGSNVFFGGSSGGNVLVSGDGPSTLVGGGTGDLLAESGDEGGLLVAGPGEETLTAGASTVGNVFFGGTGADLMVAGAGEDTVLAGAGNQTIFGGSLKPSLIFAGAGQDLIVAGSAQDFIAAGSGSALVFAAPGDVFSIVNGQAGGALAIVGFSTGSDLLQLVGYGGDAGAAAVDSAVVGGGSTVLTLPDATQVVFYGVTNLTAASFF